MTLRLQSAFLALTLTLAACGSAETEEFTDSPALGEQQSPVSFPTRLNTCGNEATKPQIFSNTFASPNALLPGGSAPSGFNPANGRFSRGGIQYVSGNGVRMELVTDKCTYIKEVKVGSTVLTTSYTNGFWYSAQASTSQPKDPTRYGYNLWVFFPYQGDGSTDMVTITVGRDMGRLTETYSFPLVRVDSVNPVGATAPINFTRAELFNMFGKALYEKFNGATNSTRENPDDPNSRRIYGYDPSKLQVAVTSSGVTFGFDFKAEVNGWCDPTVHAQGKFTLNADNQGISVHWETPASGSLDWPFLCEIVQVIPILGIIPAIVYDVVEADNGKSVADSVEKAVTDSLPTSSTVNFFLDGSTVQNGQLLVNLKVPAPSIGVRTPYDAFDMTRTATQFPAGDAVLFLASGLGMNDTVANVTPTTTLSSGPNGVPRVGVPTWPFPLTVARTGNLVWNTRPVGRLLARNTSTLKTTTYNYEPGCSITIPGGGTGPGGSGLSTPYLKLGVNDTAADAQRLRGGFSLGYSVRAFFLSEVGLGASLVPSCASVITTPVFENGVLAP
ncbi:hypothetical protein FJV41_04865 [Myxococcus llanfairpwllgwyngyllgogerychwyrndrobwllllantysiliogogogochensis]|uniref:Lipoprotein n=1 Tax=Myxococcus llanfairpwllgwyngyllgogerychwyrndrobwllllantysiliogogogochensis TaxID=2590453 RepID=A0A540X7G3_9BACT|nr:hypothetical protein [Myxococcus llanfairpwllgwyngyllgogerychwyrndrobwllllantysiliogogogochensis]TQF17122.1 hypothetical protein FJV41_04865 [Myxococcus llanfairpwllgwyngyllgogerychwyrndrobwllllantysiliogogogochensis]